MIYVLKICLVINLLFIYLVFGLQIPTELEQVISKSDGFTLKLPDNWIEIPKSIIDEYTQAFTDLIKYNKNVNYDYGFQLSDAEYWLQPPYILIQVDNSGRIPEGEFKNVKKMKESFNKGIDDFSEKSDALFKNIDVNEPVYDSENHILWILGKTFVEGVGEVRTFSGWLLTERGMVRVLCYSLEDDYLVYVPLFEKIILECDIDEGIKYNPKWSDSMPFLQRIDWSKVIAYSIIGGLIVLLSSYFKKRKDNKLY